MKEDQINNPKNKIEGILKDKKFTPKIHKKGIAV